MNTFAEVLTAEGRGAVAVVRVVGPRALDVVDRCFRPAIPKSLHVTGANRPRLGRFGDEHGDEVIVIPLNTNPISVEIHGHGGFAAVASILSVLKSQDVPRVAESLEEKLANAKSWSAQAGLVLPFATTLRVAEILLDQQAGALDVEWNRLVELCAETPDLAVDGLERLLARSAYGLKMVEGWKVALGGRPNVGKSSLLNRLAGYGRAVVSEIPGTTRDVLGVRAALDGWPIEFLDMAGLRVTDDVLESQGVERAKSQLHDADLVVVVLDRSHAITLDDERVLAEFPEALRVANKSDLDAAWDAPTLQATPVSAATGEGLDELCTRIVGRLVPEPPEPGDPVPFLPEMVARINAQRRQLGVIRSDTSL